MRASGIPAMGGPSAARSAQAIVSVIPASIKDEDGFRSPLSPGDRHARRIVKKRST